MKAVLSARGRKEADEGMEVPEMVLSLGLKAEKRQMQTDPVISSLPLIGTSLKFLFLGLE